MGELKLMKGNEALAEAAIRCGADAYFGYPITPQSEVIEYLSEQNPYKLKVNWQPSTWCMPLVQPVSMS